ncbi:hypothetical protein Golob_021697 [Gossypium lobatum]|uniref:DUF4283 domain-containing protein n=1 Tax=Gossypium lobatum TaxID=34289 RepID=A0A7J8LEC3_9ROSI|nr:hypothetical protein [Gossypium lobatum]
MANVEETLADLTIEEEKEEVALPLDSKGSEGGVSYENCFDCGGGHWSFNSHLLIMHRLKGGGDPMVVPLFTVHFWVLIYDLPYDFMFEMVAKQLSNFVGHFLEYDMKAISLGYKGVIREQKDNLVENNVIQNNTGWASSVGLHNRAFVGPIGGLIQSHTTRLQHVYWDNDMCNVGDDRLILHMDCLKRHQVQ